MSKRLVVPAVFVIVAMLALVASVSASAEVAWGTCTFEHEGGVYEGTGTFVFVEGTFEGKLQVHCRTRLVEGTPVPAQKVANVEFNLRQNGEIIGTYFCDAQLTPSGNANISCTNQYLSSP